MLELRAEVDQRKRNSENSCRCTLKIFADLTGRSWKILKLVVCQGLDQKRQKNNINNDFRTAYSWHSRISVILDL